MGGAVLVAVLAASLAAFGVLVATALPLESAARGLLAAYVIAWVGLVVAAVGLSVAGSLNRWTLTIAAVLLSLGAAAFRGRRGPAGRLWDETWPDALRDPIVRLLAVGLLIAGLYLAALALFTTPNDWDGLTYHETRALLWDQQGSVGYVPEGNDPRLNGNPPVSEIGLYAAMLVPRTERLAALPSLLALVAGALGVMLAGRRLGLSRPEAAYGGLVFTTLPIVFLQGASILNDLVVASFGLAAIVFLAGWTRIELALGSVALGLALSTKVTAVLALPLILLAVLVLAERHRRPVTLLAFATGVLLGSPWYLLNLAETGTLDGDLADATGQRAVHSFAAVLGTFRALAFDVVDTSGLWGADVLVAVAVGGAVALLGVLRLRRGAARRGAWALIAGGLLAAATPLVLLGLEAPSRHLWTHFWWKVGQENIALAHGDAWHVESRPDTSLSWYGAAGAVIIVGGIATAIVGLRRRTASWASLVLAASPMLVIAIFALTIPYDPWRGRLLVLPVGLACAAWGATLRVRWLSAGITLLCVTTVVLSLVHFYTKPSGIGLFESGDAASVWHRDRIDTLTVIRDYDGTPAILRAVERTVPTQARLAVAVPLDTFLAPLAGPHLSRTLLLVADGAQVTSEATWLVTRQGAAVVGCVDAWQTAFTVKTGRWRLLRRTGPDTCARAQPL
ncbi:MAG TPA: hypothetical protein VFG75_11985 [Gaiella sp.]|nr:hypothetical protein [Gaiella sp.]